MYDDKMDKGFEAKFQGARALFLCVCEEDWSIGWQNVVTKAGRNLTLYRAEEHWLSAC